MTQIPFIGYHCDGFPPVENALDEPNGLLVAGGDLAPERLIEAYSKGIFPWYEDDQPILWWSPAPRAVLYPAEFSPSRSLKKTLRKQTFKITVDTVFPEVIVSCSKPRISGDGTWITTDMTEAYIKLHQLGYAHSIEAWAGSKLVGGLYGICLGSIFFGESMFSTKSDASKVAFCSLVELCNNKGINLIDCQVANPHLASLGAVDIPRATFKKHLQTSIPDKSAFDRHRGAWSTISK
ncbi:MAG: leucyl/phenylalanyl-tRNA--protein transferase [Pseudomonadales bacterium]|nr:leucyl/phenylalanyl-tRNA--protein transferase [Pseudomonadales bacterium]